MEYFLTVGVLIAIFVILASSYNLVIGYGGLAFTAKFLQFSHAMSLPEVANYLALQTGVVAAIGTFMGGYLADVLSRRNLGWSAWVVTAAIALSLPFSVGVYLSNDRPTVLWLMTVTILVGGLYLAGGALGAGMGLYFSIAAPHPLPGIGFATGTLAVVWFAAAAMAYRAARNKRFDSHRDWMIRSYVLTWTFVACRLVMSLPFAAKVDGATTVAIIWMAWIAPVIVCELALQWRAGARN